MTKRRQVDWLRWATFVVVYFSLGLGLAGLRIQLEDDFGANRWVRGLVGGLAGVLPILGGGLTAYFVARLVPGTQKPQSNTEIIKRSALPEPVESGGLTIRTPEQPRSLVRGVAVFSWALSLVMLGVVSGVLGPVEQTGWEASFLLVVLPLLGGLFLWFRGPSLSLLKIDSQGVLIGRKLIPWREISHCEILTRTDELGETSGVTLKLKNQSGGSLGTVFCTPNEAERARLRDLIRVYLGDNAA